MKSLLLATFAFGLSLSALAGDIPQIQAPSELSAGEFAEGTVTKLSAAEVAEFLPWAQNARNQLQRALNQSRSLPLRERPSHIERAVKAVVARSGSRQYQALMRFALNRGLLLVDELERSADMNDVGSQENVVDLLQRAITVGLSFYESDLTFQDKAQSGQASTVIPYAQFASAFMQNMYPGVVNVLDANAQYRLLHKLVEMVNWDLSRDADAPRYAEVIVEAYEMGQDLPEQPASDDKTNLRMIRRLNSLKIIGLQAGARSIQNNNEADLTSVSVGAAEALPPSATLLTGEVFYVDANQGVHKATVVTKQDNGNYVLRGPDGQLYTNVTPTVIAKNTGCVGEICVDPSRTYWRVNSNSEAAQVMVIGIYGDTKLILYYTNHSENKSLKGKMGGGWDASDIARDRGCSGSVCVGTTYYNVPRKVQAQVVGRLTSGKLLLKFLEGTLANQVGAGWDASDLAARSGCANGLCVGDKVVNIPRAMEAEVYALQASGKYVLRFTSGTLSGKIGEDWDKSDLTKLP